MRGSAWAGRSVLAASVFCGGAFLVAQGPAPAPVAVEVPEAQMLQKQIAGEWPLYPAIAQAAKIEANVFLRTRISPAGVVESVEVQQGHPMLNQAAVEAVRAWRFRPFVVDGLPVTVLTTVTVPFFVGWTPSSMLDLRAAEEAAQACAAASLQPGSPEVIPRCEAARKAARSTTIPTLALGPRVTAELGLGKGLLAASRPSEALRVLESALDGLKQAGSFHPARVEVLRALAQANTALGKLDEATKMCGRAEDQLKAGGSVARDLAPAQAQAYRTRLAADLKSVTLLCADIFDRAGKPKDAEKARERAAAIK
jgi:TonB family protein